MKGYNLNLYQEGNMQVTEEEFVFDSNNNRELREVIEESRKVEQNWQWMNMIKWSSLISVKADIC